MKTKNRFRHRIKVKTNFVTESATNLVIIIPRKGLSFTKNILRRCYLQNKHEYLLGTQFIATSVTDIHSKDLKLYLRQTLLKP